MVRLEQVVAGGHATGNLERVVRGPVGQVCGDWCWGWPPRGRCSRHQHRNQSADLRPRRDASLVGSPMQLARCSSRSHRRAPRGRTCRRGSRADPDCGPLGHASTNPIRVICGLRDRHSGAPSRDVFDSRFSIRVAGRQVLARTQTMAITANHRPQASDSRAGQ